MDVQEQASTLSGFMAATRGDRDGVQSLLVTHICPDETQPRQTCETDALDLLAESLLAVGLLSPIEVTPADTEGMHTIVFGERRWRAWQRAGDLSAERERTGPAQRMHQRDFSRIEAIVRDRTALERRSVQIIENVHRVGLGAVEKSQAVADLFSLLRAEARADGEMLTDVDLERRLAQRLNLRTDRRIRDFLLIAHADPSVLVSMKQNGTSMLGGAAVAGLKDPAQAVEVLEAAAAAQLSDSRIKVAVRLMRDTGLSAQEAVAASVTQRGRRMAPPIAAARRRAYTAACAAATGLAGIDEEVFMEPAERRAWIHTLDDVLEQIVRLRRGIAREELSSSTVNIEPSPSSER